MKPISSRRRQRQGRGRLPADFSQRSYRRLIGNSGLEAFHVVCQETDLMVQADRRLERETHEQVLVCRAHIEGYIRRYPAFATTLLPWRDKTFAPPIVAVAGAVAENVGRHLLGQCRQVVVENGGDIFFKTDDILVTGLFAGNSPLSMKVGIKLPPSDNGMGICTSSGTVGHSLSAGSADAVCVISPSCALADAAATAIGNRIHSSRDITTAIDFGKSIAGIHGIAVVAGRELGAWGSVEWVPLNGKKG
jgi:ApbE superfamily uncharacterized protein (UPF0280 family)